MAKSNGCGDKCNTITGASTLDLLNQDLAKKVHTAYDRLEDRGMSACLFGSGGTCCKVCNMGPCQIIDGVDTMLGICGATADTVAARNFARIIRSSTISISGCPCCTHSFSFTSNLTTRPGYGERTEQAVNFFFAMATFDFATSRFAFALANSTSEIDC